MSRELDREGTFRGRIIEYGLQEGKNTSSVGIAIKVAIDEAYNFEAESWEDWREYAVECYGYVNLVKGDGSANDKSAENLCLCTGWNGSVGDIAMGEWKPEPIQFTTKANEYNGKTSFKVDYINQYDRSPGGGIKSVDADKAKALQAKYGTTFRALAANTKRNNPPADKPKSPPPAKRETVPSGKANDDTPF
jgi:hypothetical protein